LFEGYNSMRIFVDDSNEIKFIANSFISLFNYAQYHHQFV